MSLTDQHTADAATAAPPTAAIVPGDLLRIGAARRTLRFEGRDHGSAISYFLVDNDPGQGPDLHRHPYAETWIVLEGEARFTVGDDQFIASTGDTLTGPADIWHGFKNCGTGRLRVIGIHASDTIIQENLE